MQIRFSSTVFDIDHPDVHRLTSGEITPEEFVAGLTDEDPFTVGTSGEFTVVSGVNRDVLKSIRHWSRKNAVADVRERYGISPEELAKSNKALEFIRRNWPDTEELLDEDVSGEGCTGCRRAALLHKALSEVKPLREYLGTLDTLKDVCSPLGLRILAGDTDISDDDILRERVETKGEMQMSKMREFPRLPARKNFFESEDCGKGGKPENCRFCRLVFEHRRQMNIKYAIPMFVPIKGEGADRFIVQVSKSHETIEDFDCPYGQAVGAKYPGLFTQAGNALAALGRVVSAFSEGSRISLDDKQAVDARRATCEACPRLDRQQMRCTSCGCFIQLKMSLATEDCPDGRWPTRVDFRNK